MFWDKSFVKKGILISLLPLILLKSLQTKICVGVQRHWICWCCQGSAGWKQLEQPPLLNNLPWGSFANLSQSTGMPGPSVQCTDAFAAEHQQLWLHPWQECCHHVVLAKIPSEEGTQPTSKYHFFLLNSIPLVMLVKAELEPAPLL